MEACKIFLYLIKIIVLASIFCSNANTLGIQGDQNGFNNWFEIIVEKQTVDQDGEISYTEIRSANNVDKVISDIHKDSNEDEKPERVESKRFSLVDLNLKPNIQSPTYIDNGPPPYTEYARMARYIVHYSEWTSMATICSRDPLKGFPFSNTFSVSDGASVAKSTGIPYFYVPSLEMSVHDLKHDPRASVSMTLAQGSYCKKKNLDPEDPRCAHVIISGTFSKIDVGSQEETFAREALFTRHPEMEDWNQPDHGWFFAKIDIKNILLLDYFGGATTIPVKDYLKATPF